MPLTLLGLRLFHAVRRRRDGHARPRPDRVPDEDRRARRRGRRQRGHRAHRAARLDRRDRAGEGARSGSACGPAAPSSCRPATLRLERWAREHQPHARHVTFGEGDARRRGSSATSRSTPAAIVELDVFGERHELRLQLVGKHAALDACAALAAAHAAGASRRRRRSPASRARGRPRCAARSSRVGGRKVIVDCYNANPASMAAALRTLAERAQGDARSRSLGDMLELGDHAPRRAPRGRRAREASSASTSSRSASTRAR